MLADVTGGLQPFEDGRPLPGRLINHRLGVVRQYARDVFPEAAAGQMGDGVDVNAGNQVEDRFHIDAGRRQQMVGQRFAVKVGGLWVNAANFNNLTHQRIAVRVRAAGGQRHQHIAVSDFAAVDDF